MLWFQRARVRWIEHGDRNTKFYHASIRSRKRQNLFHSIRTEDGELCTEPDKLKDLAVAFFSNLFSAQEDVNRSYLVRGKFKALPYGAITDMTHRVSDQEICDVIFSMNPYLI